MLKFNKVKVMIKFIIKILQFEHNVIKLRKVFLKKFHYSFCDI